MDHQELESPDMAADGYAPPEDDAFDAADDSDAPVTLAEQAAGSETVPVAANVRAENVTLYQGGAQTIDAGTVSITQGGAGRVRADELTVNQGGVGFAEAKHLTVADQGSALAVVADEATVEDGGRVVLLIARSVAGDVRPLLDVRSALAMVAGFAFVLLVLRRIR